VIFIYSMMFTSLVSFFAVMIIPDAARQNFLTTSSAAFHVPRRADLRAPALSRLRGAGGHPDSLRRREHRIIGSNGVLNRVAEDGVLPDWFRHPHKKFGTTSASST